MPSGRTGWPLGWAIPGNTVGHSSLAIPLVRWNIMPALENFGESSKRSEVDSLSLVWLLIAESLVNSILGNNSGDVNLLPGRSLEIPVKRPFVSGRRLNVNES